MFETLLGLTAIIVAGSAVHAFARYRDPFHPLIYLGAMMLFLYVWLPGQAYFNHRAELLGFLSLRQLELVQTINLLGVTALCFGALAGSGGPKPRPNRFEIPSGMQRRVRQAALVVGLLGVAGFGWTIVSTGGLWAAYGHAYGGGSAASGYLRVAFMMTLPALLGLLLVHHPRRPPKQDLLWMAVFAMPLLIHGLLGARRGPTFMILAALGVGWYLAQGRRPRLLTTLAGGVGVGLLLLLLVSNRSDIFLGSDFRFGGLEHYDGLWAGNEFVYGSGTILDAKARGEYFWGRRYFVVVFVRPIPRALWPTQYEDMSRLLDIPNLEQNLGTGGERFQQTVGWAGTAGAAPGIIADLWLELWWLCMVVLFVIGFGFARVWRNALVKAGPWLPLYALMVALSVYLIMQTLEAFLFRFLLLGLATYVVWRPSQFLRRRQKLRALHGRAPAR